MHLTNSCPHPLTSCNCVSSGLTLFLFTGTGGVTVGVLATFHYGHYPLCLFRWHQQCFLVDWSDFVPFLCRFLSAKPNAICNLKPLTSVSNRMRGPLQKDSVESEEPGTYAVLPSQQPEASASLLVTDSTQWTSDLPWILELGQTPPACRRVLWIVLVSIACLGFSLRFVSPRGFFDSLTPPPPPFPPPYF